MAGYGPKVRIVRPVELAVNEPRRSNRQTSEWRKTDARKRKALGTVRCTPWASSALFSGGMSWGAPSTRCDRNCQFVQAKARPVVGRPDAANGLEPASKIAIAIAAAVAVMLLGIGARIMFQ